MIIPDEMHTLATRADEHATSLFEGYSEPTDREETWRLGYENGYARGVAHMARWCLGDGAADPLRELGDALEVDLL